MFRRFFFLIEAFDPNLTPSTDVLKVEIYALVIVDEGLSTAAILRTAEKL